jgi:predicted nucleic acid-binding protein
MTADCLVDTDVLVDFLRGNAKAVTFVRDYADRIVLSSIVLAELYAGASGEEELAKLDSLPRLFPVLSVTAEIGRSGGLLKAEYGRSHGLGLADALLAATARHHGLVLKTLNVRHFPMFPGLEPPYRM